MDTCASKVALSKSASHIRLFHALVIPPVVLVAMILNEIKSLQLILGVITPHWHHNFAKENHIWCGSIMQERPTTRTNSAESNDNEMHTDGIDYSRWVDSTHGAAIPASSFYIEF
uniref:Uncharacterized protein n=1 Tax=Glossina pallidipes TaxID=7398 RepID=A0A1A9ZDN0_GLOPL